MILQIIPATILLVLSVLVTPLFGQSKVVITDSSNHYLPKNSLLAIAVAIAQGAEVIQLELAMTRDGQIIVLSDTNLDKITNVQDQYPEKMREDGTIQALDFTLEEIKQLSLKPATSPPNDISYANTTTPAPEIRISTLPETLGVIRIMEQQLGHPIGIVAEIKKSWLHLHEKMDISSKVLSIFQQYNFTDRDKICIASYDPEELQRIHNTLLPAMGLEIKTLQLFDTNNGQETMRLERDNWQPYNYDWLLTKFGLKSLSSFADIIGFDPAALIDEAGGLKMKEYTEDAHMLGLDILAYPFDTFANPLPDFTRDIETLAEYCLFTAGFDGLLTGTDKKIRAHLKLLSEKTSADKRPKTSIEKLLEEVKRQKPIQ